MQDELLTPQEAAQYLRWTLPTIYTKSSRRQLPSVRLGRSLRFRKSDLDRTIRAGLCPALNPLHVAADEGGAQ